MTPRPITYASPYEAEESEIVRRQRLAEALQAQAGQPWGGTEMAGQIAIRRSPLEGLAQLGKSASANAQMQDVQRRRDELSKRMQGDRSADMQAMVQALQGSPGSPMPPEAMGGGPAMPARPAGQIDPSVMGQLRSPEMQNMAMQLWAQQLKPKAPIKVGAGDQLVNPDTYQPVYSAPQKPDKPAAVPSAIQEYEYAQKQGFKGSFQDFQIAQRAAGAPKISVSATAGTEKKYGEQFAGNIARADSDMRDAALKAPELAERSNRIKETLASGKITTGFGADYRLAFGKAAGLAGASDAETLKNTETLVADLASNTMDAIKASGMGGGTGFSNADRDFLEKAKGGKITLEASTINRLADLSHRAAALSADRWNKRVKEIPASALEGTGITQDAVKVPGLYSPAKTTTNPAVDAALKKYGG